MPWPTNLRASPLTKSGDGALENETMFDTHSPQDTMAVAQQIASQAKPGAIYLLNGEMGAGKTAFSKGFAQGLRIDAPITSPTFTILNIYEQGRLPLYHFDLYRIEYEIEEQGFEDYFFGQGVCLIEWGTYAMNILQYHAYCTIDISKDFTKGSDYRHITLRNVQDFYDISH